MSTAVQSGRLSDFGLVYGILDSEFSHAGLTVRRFEEAHHRDPQLDANAAFALGSECHPQAPCYVAYFRGNLLLSCSVCYKSVMVVAIQGSFDLYPPCPHCLGERVVNYPASAEMPAEPDAICRVCNGTGRANDADVIPF